MSIFSGKCGNIPARVRPARPSCQVETRRLRVHRAHLSLNAVEPSEPEDLPSPQLPLGVVDLLVLLVHVLLRQLVLLGELARPAQEAQPAVGYAGDHLVGEERTATGLEKGPAEGSERSQGGEGWKRQVTCPHTSSPSPRKTHHIHFSRSRG